MPQLVEQLPARKAGGSVDGSEKYPWREWLDGQPRLFKQGEDYQTTTKSFVSIASSAARRHGLKVQTRVAPNGVFMQAFPGD